MKLLYKNIVTCIFLIEIVRVLLDFTPKKKPFT